MEPSAVIDIGRAVSQLPLEYFFDVDDGVARVIGEIYRTPFEISHAFSPYGTEISRVSKRVEIHLRIKSMA
jgi:hypothetical protein